MYILLRSDGSELATQETLTYIKYGTNGCLTFATENDADGIVVDSNPYNTQYHSGIEGAETLTVCNAAEGVVPRNGMAGAVLTKLSPDSYDTGWRKLGGLASVLDTNVWNDFMTVMALYRMGSATEGSEEFDTVKWFADKYDLNDDVLLRSDTSGTIFTCTWQQFFDRLYSLLDDIECTDDRGASFFDWTNYTINMTWQQFAFFVAHGWSSWSYTETPDDATINAEAATYLWKWQGSGEVTNPFVMKDGTTMYLWNSLTKKWEAA